MDDERTVSEDQGSVSLDRDGPRADEGPSTVMNAFVGAGVTVVTAPLLPFSAIVGGGVAGYLQRGDLAEGATVGAAAGAVAAIPAFFVVWVLVGFLLLGGDPAVAVTSVFGGIVFVTVLGYLLGAGALGGALGAYVRQEL